jgi:hypothetical protein
MGDHICATYGFGGLAAGQYFTHVAKDGANTRYWLEVRSTKGTIHLGFGILPVAFLCEDLSGMFGKSKAAWQEITSAGLGKPEPDTTKGLDNGNILTVNELIEAIERDRAPLDSLHDGRGAGDDPRGVRIAPAGARRRAAPEEPQAPARRDGIWDCVACFL